MKHRRIGKRRNEKYLGCFAFNSPLSPLGGETMSEKTCCPNAQQLHSSTAQCSDTLHFGVVGSTCYCRAVLESIALQLGRSADALSTVLLTQTELSITVGEEVALTRGRALDIRTGSDKST